MIGLERELTGSDFNAAKAEVFRLVGRFDTSDEIKPARPKAMQSGASLSPGKPKSAMEQQRDIARYEYEDRDGKTVFEVVRYLKPNGETGFKARRPDNNGGWIESVTGVSRVPYRLPNVLAAATVYLPEGEKDVHTLESWGLTASCNPFGAGSTDLYTGWADYFRGRHIVILPDNDERGREHAIGVATALIDGAASMRIVELPGLQEKGDVSDWRDGGGGVEIFLSLCEQAARLTRLDLAELRKKWGFVREGPPERGEPQSTKLHSGSLTTRCFLDVESKPISWLWPGRIARGKLTIIAGNPGLGKSQVTASIAAVVTRGGQWPASGGQRCRPGGVLFLSAEDDPADTIRPRLEAAGADLSRVYFVDGVTGGRAGKEDDTLRTFSLRADVQALSAKLEEQGDVAVVVIDPISAYLGETDSHNNADVRGLLTPLTKLASRHDAAIIGVSHLNKAVGGKALMRVTGSLAFVAAARAAYLVAADPQDKDRRLLLPMKNNVGPDALGLAFRIEGVNVSSVAGTLATSRITWESEPVSITADEAEQALGATRSSALGDATDWLREALANGPVAAKQIVDSARAEGIAEKTIQRASKAIPVLKSKAGMSDGWLWSLSPKMAKSPEDAHPIDLATFEEFGHVREIYPQ